MKLIPPLARIGRIDSTAEARVAETLAHVKGHEPACCLYSIHLPRHEYKAMSEIDFAIVYADVVLVIEVKGGRLARRNGLWTFTNRYGQSNTKREGPFDQARSAMFSLRDRLTRQLPRLDVAFGYLVITPDQELDADFEWDPQVHAGPRAMSVSAMEATLASARRYWLGKHHGSPTGRAYSELTHALRPDFDRVPSLAARVSTLEHDYVRFAERQYELLLAAERNPRILCTGGAGSGKTLLAVETARRAAADGDTVLVTCRSEGVARLISVALAATGAVCLPFAKTADFPPVDVLIVDEGQDLMDIDAYAQLDALVKGGWERGRWRVFCDANNQANVDGHFDRAVLDDLATGATVVHLPFNCRNTATIVTQTQLSTGADLGVARAGAGPAVEYRTCPDDAAVADDLEARLQYLRREEVPADQISVITLRDSAADSAAVLTPSYRKRVLRLDKGIAVPPAAVPAPPFSHLVTAADIKGLEAAHVCIVDVDETESAHARARLYVAMTRARVSLWIALSPGAWTQLAANPKGGAHP